MKTKIRIVSADFGDQLKRTNEIPTQQNNEFELEYFIYNDGNFFSRKNALHPRLKGKIPKMLDWMSNDSDYYVWMDSYYRITSNNFFEIIKYVEDYEICLGRHKQRSSIKDESNFILTEIHNNNDYLKSRYEGEPIKEQVEYYLSDNSFQDNNLFSLGFFIYKKSLVSDKNFNLMVDWFLHNSCWSVQDQISLPYLLYKNNTKYNVFDFDVIYNNPYAKYDR
jgi:hypothetical protein